MPQIQYLPVFLGARDRKGLTAQAAAGSLGYPDASNMPSVSGSTLTYYPNYPTDLTPATQELTPQSGELNLNTPGETIEGIDLTGAYIPKAAGITIRRCRIKFSGETAGILIDTGHGYSVTIEDCVLDGGTTTLGATAVGSENFTIRRCNIFGPENGFDCGTNIDIRHCFVHDLYQTEPAHTDGIQAWDGSSMTVYHCTFLAGSNGTSAINVNNSGGGPTTSNVLIDDNVLAGGAYTMYFPIPATSNYVVSNNKFWNLYYPDGGNFGHWTDLSDETISGNELGSFSGGLVGNVITGTWSGTPLTS